MWPFSNGFGYLHPCIWVNTGKKKERKVCFSSLNFLRSIKKKSYRPDGVEAWRAVYRPGWVMRTAIGRPNSVSAGLTAGGLTALRASCAGLVWLGIGAGKVVLLRWRKNTKKLRRRNRTTTVPLTDLYQNYSVGCCPHNFLLSRRRNPSIFLSNFFSLSNLLPLLWMESIEPFFLEADYSLLRKEKESLPSAHEHQPLLPIIVPWFLHRSVSGKY